MAASTASSAATASAARPTPALPRPKDLTRLSRPELLAAKLRGLVANHLGPAERTSADFPGGAALLDGDSVWLLLDEQPLKALGPALVWADRRGLSEVNVISSVEPDVIARRATCFRSPPRTWLDEGTTLRPVDPASPATAPPVLSVPALAELLVDADLEVVAEEGVLRGEILGLEVARIVHGVSTGGVPLDEPMLEVGVGHADREMTAVIHAGLPPTQQLARVSEIVRAQRRDGAEPHPLNQLAPERWLRATLVADPARLGLRELRPVAPAVPRPNLRDRSVAMAHGVTADGASVVVACSVGVDLDLVPAAADARLSVDPDAELWLVVPERDAHPVTAALAARLRAPARIVTVPDTWRSP